MTTYCSTCTVTQDATCNHCCNGSKYEGPDAETTYSVGLFPSCTIRRHVTFKDEKKDNRSDIKGSEDMGDTFMP